MNELADDDDGDNVLLENEKENEIDDKRDGEAVEDIVTNGFSRHDDSDGVALPL